MSVIIWIEKINSRILFIAFDSLSFTHGLYAIAIYLLLSHFEWPLHFNLFNKYFKRQKKASSDFICQVLFFIFHSILCDFVKKKVLIDVHLIKIQLKWICRRDASCWFCCEWPRFYHKRMRWWNSRIAFSTHIYGDLITMFDASMWLTNI